MSVMEDNRVIEGVLGFTLYKTIKLLLERWPEIFLPNMSGSLILIFKGKPVPLGGCRTVRQGSLPA